MRKLVWADTAVGLLDGEIGPVILLARYFQRRIHQNLRGDVTGVGLASDQLLPGLSTLTDNVGSIPACISNWL